ncbi:MAG: hypothetical protein K2R98_24055 [Gemmataceae bacterium]|nr:hypothetical protein [Gemmataceae bacterium]
MSIKTLEQPRPISGLASCPKTGTVATSMATVIYLWNPTTGEHLRTIEKAGPLLAYSPDGSVLATDGGVTCTCVVLWDPATGKELAELRVYLQRNA